MLVAIPAIIIFVISLIGYVLNIYKLVTGTEELSEIAMMEVVRIIGIIFPPVGSVMGFF